jgi:spermidine synthase
MGAVMMQEWMKNIPDYELEIIERCITSRGEIQLQRRGANYEIISNGTFLMATYNGESEKILVKEALNACEKHMCTVLIGGLGVGYSLAEAVSSKNTKQVTVIEIEEKIIDWNRLYLNDFSENAIDNMKTRIICADLIQWMSQTKETFDVICMDIDNGPDWTIYQENNCLYDDEGLKIISRLLKPDGVISFWSASSSPSFMERLKLHFSIVKEFAIEQKRNVEPDFVYISKL